MHIRKRPIPQGQEIIIYHPHKPPLVMRFYVRIRLGTWCTYQCYKGFTYITEHPTRELAEHSRDACIAEIEQTVRKTQTRVTTAYVLIDT